MLFTFYLIFILQIDYFFRYFTKSSETFKMSNEPPLSPRRNDEKYHPKLMLSSTLMVLGYKECDAKYRVVRVESKKGRPYLGKVNIPQGEFYGEPETNILCAEISAAFEAMRFLARIRQFQKAVENNDEVEDTLNSKINELIEKYTPKKRIIYSATTKLSKQETRSRSGSRRLSTGDLGIVMPNKEVANLDTFLEEEEET